jgi:hypothetical protein
VARIVLALTLAAGACAPAPIPDRRPPFTSTTVAPLDPHPPSTTVAPSLHVTTTTAPPAVTASSVQAARPPSTTVAPPVPVVAEGAAPREGMPGQDVTLACIREWESRGNYRAVSRSGRYRGAYQFDRRTWESNGGTGDPAEAAPAEQDQVASVLLERRGLSPWPTPARRCA